jgi:hypothetical protein
MAGELFSSSSPSSWFLRSPRLKSLIVTHYFGHPDDDFTSMCSGSQNDFLPEKSNFFPPLQDYFLERVRRLHILHSAKIYDFRRLHYRWPVGFLQAAL